MAKTSWVVKNEKRKVLTARHAAKRRELRKIVKNPKTTVEERAAAYHTLRGLPRDSSATRIRNRCQVSGRDWNARLGRRRRNCLTWAFSA